jgi:hypothetical protein
MPVKDSPTGENTHHRPPGKKAGAKFRLCDIALYAIYFSRYAINPGLIEGQL